jgi:cell division protein FtsW
MNRRIDHWLLLIVTLLITGGMLMVFSASAVGNPNVIGAEFKYLLRQGMAFSVGVFLCIICSLFSSKVWRGIHHYLYFMMVVGLIFCFIPGIGHTSHGASRWIGFGSINFQPSAFAKIAVLISLAAFLHNNRGKTHLLPVLIKATIIPSFMIAFIILEPDFGTSLIIGTLSFFMMIIAGMRIKHLITTGFGLTFLGTIVLLSEEYRF